MNLHCSACTAITNNNNVSNSRIWERYKQWIVFWSNYDLPELDLNSNQPWKGKCSRCRVNIWISPKIQMNQVYLCLGIAKFARIIYFYFDRIRIYFKSTLARCRMKISEFPRILNCKSKQHTLTKHSITELFGRKPKFWMKTKVLDDLKFYPLQSK